MADEVVNVNVKREPHSLPLTLNPKDHLEDPSTKLQLTQTQADPGSLTDPNDLTQVTQPVHSPEIYNLIHLYSRSNHSIAAPLAPLNLTAANNIKRGSNFNSNSSNTNVARKPSCEASLNRCVTAPSLKRKSSTTSATNRSENLPTTFLGPTKSNGCYKIARSGKKRQLTPPTMVAIAA